MATATRTPRAGNQGRLMFRISNEMVYFVGVVLFMTVATFVDTRRLTRAAQMHHHGAWSGKPGKLLPLRSQLMAARTWQGRRSIGESSIIEGEEEDDDGGQKTLGWGRARGSFWGVSRVRSVGNRERAKEEGNFSDGAVQGKKLRVSNSPDSVERDKKGEGEESIKLKLVAEGEGQRGENAVLRDGAEEENGTTLAIIDAQRNDRNGEGGMPGTGKGDLAVQDGKLASEQAGIVTLPESCPPMFSAPPACREGRKNIPSALRAAAPALLFPFTEPFLFLRHMAEGKSQVVSSKPPDWERSLNIGPVNNALLQVLPTKDLVFGAERYRRCAIVGSSGILLHHKNGPTIDVHDLVFRFNSAPTKGFEDHVGGRTTHRITNTRNFGFHESGEEVVFVHLRTERSLNLLREVQRAHPTRRLFGFNPEFHRYMDRSFGFLSTSGLCGIVMALHKCVDVNLYGFHMSESHGVQYHYHNRTDAPANTGRDDSEWKVVKAMAESGYLRLTEPCIMECHDGKGEACEQCLRQNPLGRRSGD